MRWLTNFGNTFWSNVTDPSALKKFRMRTFGAGVGYLYLVLLCTSIIVLLPHGAKLFMVRPMLGTWITEAKTTLKDVYPKDLVVTVKNGEVSTNMKEPYAIDLPERVKKEFTKDATKAPQHLVVFDTQGSIENFTTYQTFILVTKKNVAFQDKDKGIRVMSVAEMGDFAKTGATMNRATYDSIMSKALPFLDFIPGIVTFLAIGLIFIFPFLFAALGLVKYLIYLVVGALLAWVIARVQERNLDYGELYVLGFYGLTLPILYRTVEYVLDFHIGWIFTLIFLVWMGAGMMAFPKKA